MRKEGNRVGCAGLLAAFVSPAAPRCKISPETVSDSYRPVNSSGRLWRKMLTHHHSTVMSQVPFMASTCHRLPWLMQAHTRVLEAQAAASQIIRSSTYSTMSYWVCVAGVSALNIPALGVQVCQVEECLVPLWGDLQVPPCWRGIAWTQHLRCFCPLPSW